MEADDLDPTRKGQDAELLEHAGVPVRQDLDHVGLELDVDPPVRVLQHQIEDRLEALRDDPVLHPLGVQLPGRNQEGERIGNDAHQTPGHVLDVEVEEGQGELMCLFFLA